MADRDMLSIDLKSLAAAQDASIRRGLRAAKEGLGVATRELELSIEQAIAAAVPGKLWRAIKSDTYPYGSQVSRHPVGVVYANGGPRTQGAIRFFTEPGRVAARDGFFLAIPLPAAGSRGDNRDLTPGEWERRTGITLRFVYRPGRASLLVADEGTLNARTGTYRPITRRRTQADARRGFTRGATTTPIFVLIPSVGFANRVSLRPLIDSAGNVLAREVTRRLLW